MTSENPSDPRSKVSQTPTNEQRYYDALKRISSYMTLSQIERDAKHGGLSVSEYIEMAYDNMREEAKRAIKGKRRP